jgi:hypothetical protein
MTSIEIEKTWIGWMKPTAIFAMRLTDLQLKTDSVMISVQRHAEKWVRWTDADIVRRLPTPATKLMTKPRAESESEVARDPSRSPPVVAPNADPVSASEVVAAEAIVEAIIEAAIEAEVPSPTPPVPPPPPVRLQPPAPPSHLQQQARPPPFQPAQRDRPFDVHSLADNFNWPADAVAVSEEDAGMVQRLVAAMQDATISTAFSGIGSPETADALLREGLLARGIRFRRRGSST